MTTVATIFLKLHIRRLQERHRQCTPQNCLRTPITGPCTAAEATSPGWKSPVDDLPTLIVTPLAALDVWMEQLNLWRNTPMDIRKLHGASKESLAKLTGKTVIVTTYHTIIARFSSPKDYRFSKVICDEIHDWRNTNSVTAKQLLDLRRGDTVFCLLTGTPMPKGPPSLNLIMRALAGHDENQRYQEIVQTFKTVNSSLQKASRVSALDADRGEELERAGYEGFNLVKDGLRSILQYYLIRRTSTSQFQGKPVIVLPKQHAVEHHLSFANDAARRLYVDFVSSVAGHLSQGLNRPAVIRSMDLSRMCANFPALALAEHSAWRAQGDRKYQELADHYSPHLDQLHQTSAKSRFLVNYCAQLRNLLPHDAVNGPRMREKVAIFFNQPVEVVIMTEVPSARRCMLYSPC